MQDHTSASSLDNAIALQKYGVGQPVRRKEDDTLVRGKGKYTDDFALPGQAYCWMVRSSHAHGIIKGIGTATAKAMPGVLGVWTGKDLEAAGYNPFTCGLPLKSRDGSPLLQTNRPALATDKVRFVGDPIAFVVAETLAQARDAAEAVELDIDPLPAVTNAAEATKPGAPQLYDHIPNNVALDYHYGDTARIDAAFASAVHVTKLDIVNTRVAVVSMEPRVALAAYDKANERYTLQVPTQGVSGNTVLTNTTLMGAYRGAGRPEANYYMERLIDRAADEMGINRLTLRKRNFIKPAQLPFAASSGVTYDSGDFQGVFNKALEISDHAGFAKRKKESRKRGKLRGISVGSYLEVTAPPGVELGKIVFENDGSVRLITGTLDYGQGHATPFAQVLCAQLGVPFENVKLELGDSDVVHTGNGTGGSRSITASGMAIVEASKLVIEKGKRAAAHLMEAAEADIEFGNGRFVIAGTDRSIDIIELARRMREGKMPEGVPPSLDVDHTSEPVPSTFPNGCHVAEVEIDPDTGIMQIVRYTGVNDFGTIVNPMLVAGQLHDGVAQWIGQALIECVSYDESGQPITGSVMDYSIPRAEDIPIIAVGRPPVSAKSKPLGTKGCRAARCAGRLPTLGN